jgi:hypothetical protein
VLLCCGLPERAWAQEPTDGPTATEPLPISKLPSVSEYAEAEYPELALKQRMEARVMLELDIDEQGSVTQVGVDRVELTRPSSASTGLPDLVVTATGAWAAQEPLKALFVRSSTRAAQRLRFSPAEADGQPVPVRIGFTYNFKLPATSTASSTLTSEAEPTAPPGVINLQGTIRERGTRKRLPGVVVALYQTIDGRIVGQDTLTDERGVFSFRDVPPGRWGIRTEFPGFFPYQTSEQIQPSEQVEVTYFIERGLYNPYDVTVEAAPPKKEVNRRTLTRQEILKVPGTLGDPILVIENLPGVARPTPGSGQIIVRGSGPGDTGIFIDGVNVPIIYHFGGLRSVIPATLIETVDFYPGNFSVFYGAKTGGVFDAHIRRIAPDQFHGVVDVSLLDASLFFEVPVTDDFAIAIAGRRSYIDAVIGAVVPDDSSASITQAPVYYDYQILADWRPHPHHEVRLFFLGSDDRIQVLFDNPAEANAQLQSGDFNAGTRFNRVSAAYNYTPSDRFQNSLRFAFGNDVIGFNLGDQFRFDLDSLQFQIRDTVDVRFAANLSMRTGFDTVLNVADVEFLGPEPRREGETSDNPDLSDVTYANINNLTSFVGSPFVELDWQFGDLSLVPGLRADYFTQVDELSFDPRVVVRYQLHPEWAIKAGVARVHQAPLPQDTTVEFGNPDLELQRAMQYSIGGEWRPRPYLFFETTFFYKDLQNLVSRTGAATERDGQPVPLVYDNGGEGQVYGLEVFIEHKFSNNFRGWISYTLSRAQRTDSGETESRLFTFDQTHILNVVASYAFPENWELGFRMRLVSGNPFTPFTGSVYLSDFDRFEPVPGVPNSERFATFHQLDIRLDKTWIWDDWTLNFYLSLTNAYNRANVEGLRYNFDFSQSQPINGLPIFPILGVRAEF